jgi:putative nucleotidyltransferase with HDIG domain
MPTVSNSGKRERPPSFLYRKLFDNLRSQLTWLDLLAGFGAAVIIAALLVGFRYQAIPDLRVGDIANQDVRAMQDLVYEDVAATTEKREAARASVPALYQLDSDAISSREAEISRSFAAARDILVQMRVPPKGEIKASREKEILKELQEKLTPPLPQAVLPVFLRQRFSPVLEGQILKIVDTVLRDGIVSDRKQFLQDQRIGILLRDSTSPFEHPLSDAYLARDLPAAKEYLRQFHLEFSELAGRDRTVLIQYLDSLLTPTLVYNRKETEARRELAALRVPPVEMQIKQGKIIVRNGEEVSQSVVTQLEALKYRQRPRSLLWQFGGFFFFVAVFIYILWRYFVHYQARHRKIRSHTVLVLVVIVSQLAAMRLCTALADILSERFDSLRDPFVLYYAIPFAFGAVLVTLLVDVNMGILASVILAALTGLFYDDTYLTAYLLIGSFAAIFSIRQYKDRAAILKAGLTIGTVNLLSLIAFDLLRQSQISLSTLFTQISLAYVGGILASALASMFLPALESLFRITTDIRLLELSNLNAPILRRLSVEAPGTYHHSLMVGTLAEAAAEAIGANPLLVRVAAYYHDVGKMLKPEYFVENQAFGINKHENLSPNMSCIIIASHVKDGLELAKEIGLAPRIRDMIPQHHGTRIMTYFYQKAKDSPGTKDQEIIEADFRYPGPKPQSKEAAIMMMADSVEAASRTLTNPTPAQIQGMIDRLVDAILADNQFDECDITLRDVSLVKESFLKILTGIYHRRIDYPGYDFKSGVERSGKSAAQDSSPKQATAV